MKKKSRHGKRITAILLSLIMAVTIAPGMAFADSPADAAQDTTALTEGTYVPNQVIVLFKDGAVQETAFSIKEAKALKETGKSFGAKLNAVGDAGKAASQVKSEISVLKSSLGSAFIIEDTLDFGSDTEGTGSKAPGAGQALKSGLNAQTASASDDDALRIALVSSTKYSTEEMIEMLSKNPDVEAVEPNSYIHYEDYDDYALNDAYASYLYQDNSPDAVNTAGDRVDYRGAEPDKAISTNAGSGWKKLSGDEEEVVVAVVDTGINLEHEDLVNVLWTNPGDIGLEGEHGYNFGNNSTDVMDVEGHGSHCAGIIAAQANNGIGVAGVASAANVKIMMLKNASGADEDGTLYIAMGAYNYIIRAKQRGVNIVATSNSWGRADSQSSIFTNIVDRMGEAGIISFFAAGNSWADLDRSRTDNPGANESDYSIVVGAGGIDGKAAGFTNYGKQTVDLFAPGVNMLSTVGYESYIPNIYSEEKLKETTEYFGKFTTDVEVTDGTAAPTTGGVEGIKEFGALEFHKQPEPWSEVDPEDIPDTATCEVEVVPSHYFTTGEKAASLRVTIKDAHLGEQYYIFFPYEKNENTADDNTKFSIHYQSGDNKEGLMAMVYGGEIVLGEDGYELVSGGTDGHDLNDHNANVDSHMFNTPNEYSNPKINDYEEGAVTGIGLKITPYLNEEYRESAIDEPQNLELYIDSVAVSLPGAEIGLEDSYEMMSGTSMACPAAAGAGALMAALNPKQDDQTYAEYAAMIRSKLFSCVTRTDELADLCSTGGYIDFRNIESDNPAITDAICDLDKNTVIIKGANFEPDMQLSYCKVLDPEAQEVILPADGMTVKFAADGQSVVIDNARKLFGTFLEFSLKKDDKACTGGFFLVKGQKHLEEVLIKHYPNPGESTFTENSPELQLFSNKKGTELYAYSHSITGNTIKILRFDGDQFVDLPGGNINEEFEKMMAAKGYDEFQLANNISMSTFPTTNRVLTDGNVCYAFVSSYNYAPMEGESESIEYLAEIDVSKKNPVWTFREMDSDDAEKMTYGTGYAVMDGKLYVLKKDPDNDYDEGEKMLYSLDLSTLEFKKESELSSSIYQAHLFNYKDNLYCMFGARGLDVNDEVLKYDKASAAWEVVGHLRYDGKRDEGTAKAEYQVTAVPVDNGILLVNMSFDGAGNVSIYDPEKDQLKPLYYTLNDGINNQPYWGTTSVAATLDGIYYVRDDSDEQRRGYGMWKLPADSGAYWNPFAYLSKTSASLKAGKTLTLKATGGTVKSWKSSNTSVCKVSKGKLTALKKGSATITATLKSGQKKTCKVKVTTSPKLSKTSITVKKGKTVSIKITGKAAGVKNVYTNTKIAKVISKTTATTIKIKGLKKGKTTLKIKVNGVVLKLKVTVK